MLRIHSAPLKAVVDRLRERGFPQAHKALFTGNLLFWRGDELLSLPAREAGYFDHVMVERGADGCIAARLGSVVILPSPIKTFRVRPVRRDEQGQEFVVLGEPNAGSVHDAVEEAIRRLEAEQEGRPASLARGEKVQPAVRRLKQFHHCRREFQKWKNANIERLIFEAGKRRKELGFHVPISVKEAMRCGELGWEDVGYNTSLLEAV